MTLGEYPFNPIMIAGDTWLSRVGEGFRLLRLAAPGFRAHLMLLKDVVRQPCFLI